MNPPITMFSTDQTAAIIDAAVRNARRYRSLRRAYGLPMPLLGWITLGMEVLKLVLAIIEILRERGDLNQRHPEMRRVQVYAYMANNRRHGDPLIELIHCVDEAELEVTGR